MNTLLLKPDVVIVGGGPAGCVVATRLAGFGYDVAMVTRPRRHHAIEGLSQRALKGLEFAGFEATLDAFGPPVRRMAEWNGERRAANRESLVDRPVFDAALTADTARLGVRVLTGTVRRMGRAGEAWRVAYQSAGGREEALCARFVVDARGRASRRGARSWRSGPAAFALARRCRSFAGRAPGTVVIAYADGWAWLADAGDDRAIAQLFVSGGRALPPRRQIDDFFEREIARATGRAFELRATGRVTVRDAATAMRRKIIMDDFAAVGDAALAIDPLSGHGMFEAVSGALALAPAVNTLISRPDDGALARAFYADKLETDFLRLARVGRDFYRTETRFADRDFWRQRREWPDHRPAHDPPFSGPARIEHRAVSEDGLIVERAVVITPDHPRGIWQVAGVPLAELAALAREYPAARADLLRAAARRFDRPGDDVEVAAAWLRQRGMLPAS